MVGSGSKSSCQALLLNQFPGRVRTSAPICFAYKISVSLWTPNLDVYLDPMNSVFWCPIAIAFWDLSLSNWILHNQKEFRRHFCTDKLTKSRTPRYRLSKKNHTVHTVCRNKNVQISYRRGLCFTVYTLCKALTNRSVHQCSLGFPNNSTIPRKISESCGLNIIIWPLQKHTISNGRHSIIVGKEDDYHRTHIPAFRYVGVSSLENQSAFLLIWYMQCLSLQSQSLNSTRRSWSQLHEKSDE